MKYTKEMTDRLVALYTSDKSIEEIQEAMKNEFELTEPLAERSIIAKLASVGVYKRKEYLNKRGEKPIKKEEYVERIAHLLDVNLELLESLEKVNKNVLKLIEDALAAAKEA